MPSDVAATIDHFLAWEEAQEERYERVGGVITMMTGGTHDHAMLKVNAYVALRRAPKRAGCTAIPEGVKLRSAKGDYFYPDAFVVCGETVPGRQSLAERAVVVVEVLSPSTERRDRGVKRRAYQAIASLEHYVLVSSASVLVEVFSRRADGSWSDYAVYTEPGDQVLLPAIEAALPMAEIYDGITGLAEPEIDPREVIR